MSDRVTLSPGIHYDIDAEVYHADPAPEPSLSSGIAKTLVMQSPAHAWHAHPRLGAAAPEASNAMDLGTLCHALTLGRGRRVEIIQADDWRTKAARDAREAARAAGHVPCLAHAYEAAQGAVASARHLLRQLEGAEAAIEDGAVEVVAIWRDGPSWCRAMADIAPRGLPHLYDLKFTGRIAEPLAYARTLAAEYALQGAFYPRGFQKIEGGQEREMVFVVVETDPPYSAVPFALAPELLDMAREQVEHALAVWRGCIATDEWPGYPADLHYVEAPPWVLAQWKMRQEIAAFRDRVAAYKPPTDADVQHFIDNADAMWRG